MELMSPPDAMCMLAESREHPMHVGALQLFTPPADAGPQYARDTYEAMLKCDDVAPLFTKRPARVMGAMSNVWCSPDAEIDLDYHVRHSALPAPGGVRELLELTAHLHGTLLDRHRPLWETHLIEGLQDGRFAIYTKLHHAMVDGVSGLRLLQGSLTTDPHDTDFRMPWSPPKHNEAARPKPGRVQQVSRLAKSAAAMAPSTLRLAHAALSEQQMALPYRAPRTMLNVPVGGARRLAAQSWSLDRIAVIKKAAGASVNDVVLAMCAGALRAYLLEHDALPQAPLIALVPVSLRTDDSVGGNAVTGALCNLATQLDDPADRLFTIQTSMRDNKKMLSQLPRPHAMALGMGLLASGFAGSIPGLSGIPQPFNVCISNVLGARNPLYAPGARLQGSYPMSIAANGQALNIMLVGSGDSLDFGLVGCRRAVPHLQPLLAHLETSLQDLEQAVGL
jgi:WS/DGAT/MGAT family acyltransferase